MTLLRSEVSMYAIIFAVSKTGIQVLIAKNSWVKRTIKMFKVKLDLEIDSYKLLIYCI
jgi:hypothetical protein